ncbi:MAG: efflux RND transporter permease subunit [Micrococcales bacterium]|nr:efflux RND transporter permease subunit [Micrococcales bacterium]OJX67607.1 MAG: hydrogenase expression protein [Micrococcales bacterium 72-143]
MSLLSVFSLRNRALIALLTIVVALFGGYALTALKLELFPSLTLPNVTIVTTYPGASPAVVENDVSTPIETAIQGVEGLDSTSATSSAGISTVQASFAYGTDLTRAEQKVELAIGRIQSQLPSAVDPQVVTFSIGDFPVVQLAVTSNLEPAELASRLETLTKPAIEQLDGVSAATVYGATGQRITITPDAAALAADGLSTQAIRDALKANGILIAAGTVDEGDKTLTVQAGVKIDSVETLQGLPLQGGAPATIGDVAEVQIVDNPITGISRVNGEPSLTIAITKTPAGNTVEVSRAVNDELDALATQLGGDTKFTVVFDQAPFIERSINSLATEGLLGLGFAVVVIFVFLLSIRSTLVAAISIPVSVLITFVAMLATGYSLNVLTLGALTIAIGRVVDDSIVVIENIKRHLGLGEEKKAAILAGVKEVATAITASTVTTVAVFLPIALVGDITGELFRPFALTVTIALLASLFVALTIVPVLAYWFLKVKPHHAHDATEADAAHPVDELEHPSALQRGYLPVIKWTVAHPAVTIVAALLVLVGTLALTPLVPTNFVGGSGQNTLTIQQTMPAGTSLDAKDAAAKKLEGALDDVDGLDTVQVSVGSGGSGSALAAIFGGGGSTTFSITTDESVDQDALRSKVQHVIDGLDADEVGQVSVSSGSGGGGFSNDIAIKVTAPDAGALQKANDQIVAAMKKLDVSQQVESNLSETQPYIAIQVDRAKAAAVGLSEVAVGGIVAEAMLPASIGSVELDGSTLSVYIDNPAAPTTVDELRAFTIPTLAGPQPLSELATVEEVDGPASISTQRGVRTATVSITPDTADIGTASASVQSELDALELPDGVTATIGGVTADQQDAFSQLGLALLAAILIVYTVMVATFRSLRQPLLLLVSVPFAATGAILLQLASGIPLGVASIIGLLMLIGIVVTNAIVLVDLVNQYRERGMGVVDAVVHGASRRLRPILMTALATIFALVPMAVGLTGHSGFISQPLAIVVIGGLISSTVLTLVVLPSLYTLVEGARERRAARRAAAEVTPAR